MGHFYYKEGDRVKPMFTVATANGGSRSTNVGDIKRMKKKGIHLVPSVTTIQSQLSKGDGLEHWKINEHLKQAEKLVFQHSDNLEKLLEWSTNPGTFQREVRELTEPELSKYSDAGTEAHSIFEDYVAERILYKKDSEVYPSWCKKAWETLIRDCSQYVSDDGDYELTGVWCETLLASTSYAGTVDLILRFEEPDGTTYRFIVDLKTKLNGLGKTLQTEEHRVQLVAYGELVSIYHEDSGMSEDKEEEVFEDYHANLYVSLNGDDEVVCKILNSKQEKKAYDIWRALVDLWLCVHPDE